MSVIKKERSKDHPKHSLYEAKAFVRSLKKYIPGGAVSYTLGAEAIGYSKTGKPFLNRLSAARQFGFVDTAAETIKFFPICENIINTEIDHTELDRKSFKKPPIYAKLIEVYNRKKLPSEEKLAEILYNRYGISSSAKNVAARAFLRTVDELGIVRNGIMNIHHITNKPEKSQKETLDLEENQGQLQPETEETSKAENVEQKAPVAEKTERQGSSEIDLYDKREFFLDEQRKVKICIPKNIDVKDAEYIEGMIKLTIEHIIRTN